MLERFEPKKETYNLAVFNEYFPDGKIKEIPLKEIPKDVIDYFESKSAQFILPEDYKPKNFERFFVITLSDGDQTFLAQQTKKYPDINQAEKLTYLADFKNEEIIGRAELRFNIQCDKEDEEYFKNKPFVGNIRTQENAQRNGLATKRILMMNAYSQMMYGLPLYSDTLLSPEGKAMLEKLVELGKAKKFKEGSKNRYVMQVRKIRI